CQQRQQKSVICSGVVFLKEPSEGLKPSTPSLPFGLFLPVSRPERCHRLQLVATARLHTRAILVAKRPARKAKSIRTRIAARKAPRASTFVRERSPQRHDSRDTARVAADHF